MADSVGPDAEIAARQQAFLDAKRRYDAARADASRLQIPLRTADVPAQVRERVLAEEAAAYGRAVEAQQHLERGSSQHPANQYASILEETDRIRAPALSGWEWFRQNPSLLEAVPKSDDERTRHAQSDFLLRRVQEAVAKNAGGPFAWEGYEGDGQMRSDVEAARSYAADTSAQQSLANPYHYQPYTLADESGKMLPLMEDPVYPRPYGESLTGSPLVDRVLGNSIRPLQAIWGGTGRFHDNFAAGGVAASEGRLGDAAKSFAYAVPNLVSPAFHRGGPGSEGDWRPYLKPGEAAAVDVAASMPFWFTRGMYPSRAGSGVTAVGAEARIRGLQGDLLKGWQDSHRDLLRRAVQRHHHDLPGGSAEAMRQINNAWDGADLETLRRFAQ